MVHGIVGIVVLLAVAWMLSENRRVVPWRPVLAGLALQAAIAVLVLKAPLFRQIFMGLNSAVIALQDATQAGTSFVFGYVGGGPLTFVETSPGGAFSLAFQALPLVLVIAALTALLYYWNTLPRVVRAFSWVLRKSMGIGGLGSLCPERRGEITALGAKALVAGVLASLMTGAIVGML